MLKTPFLLLLFLLICVYTIYIQVTNYIFIERNTMVYLLKENEQDARERLEAFWQGTCIDRPAISIKVIKKTDKENPSY